MRLAVREALRSFRRAPVLSVLSITTIAFALFVVGLVVLVIGLVVFLMFADGEPQRWAVVPVSERSAKDLQGIRQKLAVVNEYYSAANASPEPPVAESPKPSSS